MRVSITARLTVTSAILTALVFIPASVALYLNVAAEISAESVRNTESAARNLAFLALYQWDEDLIAEYTEGPSPLSTLQLNAPHWALIRGDGTALQSSGIFERPQVRKSPGESFLVAVDGETYRIASVPLFRSVQETFEHLPEAVQTAVREESPEGEFLRANWEFRRFKRDPQKGIPVVEIAMLEPESVRELTLTSKGRVVRREQERFSRLVPSDLIGMLAGEGELDAKDVSFAAWKAYNGQLIAVLRTYSPSRSGVEIAVSRVGERFILDEDGNVVGPDPASRLWVSTGNVASSELIATTRLRLMLALGLPLVWGAVVGIGWYITRRALSPVKRIVRAVERIELSRLDERLPVGEVQDELSSISTTINGMLDRIEEGYRRERRFTGDASHELRGPIAKVVADIDVALSQERQGGEYQETLVRCRKYAQGMQQLVESLLWLARLDSKGVKLNKRPFDVTDLVADVVRTLPADEASRVRLDLGEAERAVGALGDPDLIRVLVQNLVQNALRYSPERCPVEIRLRSKSDVALIEVQDQGEGIADDQLSHVFSRFYRVDKSRSRATGGFGLGLAIVYGIAQAHGSRVSLRNVASGGLLASFSLPACSLNENRSP